MTDVDLVLSLSTSMVMANRVAIKELEEQARYRVAFIVPVFQLNPTVLHPKLGYQTTSMGEWSNLCLWCTTLRTWIHSPVGKRQLRSLYDHDYVLQFKGNIFALGHNITNYSRWFRDDSCYEVKWGNKYEPYVIMHVDVMPWFNEVFK